MNFTVLWYTWPSVREVGTVDAEGLPQQIRRPSYL